MRWPGPVNWPTARALEDQRQALLLATADVEAFLNVNEGIGKSDPENIKTVMDDQSQEQTLRTSDLRLLIEAVKRDSL